MFLASEYDGFITGATIDVNGGVYAAERANVVSRFDPLKKRVKAGRRSSQDT